MEGLFALYIVLLAAFAGYEVISRVPTVLHTPLMSGSNFIHGIVVVGAMIALGQAEGFMQTTFGFIAVLMAAVNAVGGYVVTERMLEMFRASGDEAPEKLPEAATPKVSNSTDSSGS